MNTTTLQGLVEMTNDEYHAGPGVSSSHLKEMRRSPLHYWEKYINPEREPVAPTPAMKLGTAVHAAILEPELFAEQFCAAPQCDRRTKAGKAAYAAFEAENLGKEILSADDYDACIRMRDAVYADGGAAQLLSGGCVEQSFFTTNQDTGELIKCRPDKWRDDHNLILDVKTTDDASPAGFARSAVNFSYYLQAPWYADIVKDVTGEPQSFAFIAVEKNRPHAVAVYFVEPEDMEMGRRQCLHLLRRIAACRRDDFWPGYAVEPMPLVLPPWFKRELEEDVA